MRGAIPTLCVVLAGLLVTGIATQALSEGLTYSDGHRDGKLAFREDVKATSPITILVNSAKLSTVPAWRLEKIRDKPEIYQEGYIEAYKEGAASLLASSPKWWITSFILELIVIPGLMILLLF
ncbi:MAG: hypothetical protein U9Q23_01105 [Candidatus Bipolaricaulota bacterium]|nr:hypothetical protein [Candidatus Bipolaricaulota bacterium]